MRTLVTKSLVLKFVQRQVAEGSGLPITRAVSANQSVANNNLREKPGEWPPCLTHKLNHSNKATDCGRVRPLRSGFRIGRHSEALHRPAVIVISVR